MNEILERKLLAELNANVDHRYAASLRAWRDAGCEVIRSASVTLEKSGRHTGGVVFFVSKEGRTRDFRAIFTYVSQLRAEPAHWHMDQDWND